VACAINGQASCAGACQDNSNPCPGDYQPGVCPGPANIQCCPEPTPNCNGQCQDNSLSCSGQYAAGQCPGPDNVQCCTHGGGGGAAGLDVSVAVGSDAATCLAQKGYTFAMVRAWRSYGAFDDNAPGSLAAFQGAGFSNADAYMFPCAGQDAAQQVTSMISSLQGAGAKWNTIWLDIETNPSSGCGWGGDTDANCNYIASMISAAQGASSAVGIYSSRSMWSQIAGDGCTSGSAVPLWYAHYDGDQTCGDFSSFGGWTSPTIKQWSESGNDCGVGFDINVSCSGGNSTV